VRLVGLRGAITCAENSRAEIDDKTQRMVKELLTRNEVGADDIVSVIFTTTDDLTAGFPATAARGLGLDDVPLLGAREANVEHGLALCIRVLIHCYSDRPRHEIRHVYLEGARALRLDLAE
jgi:chorismate mutase